MEVVTHVNIFPPSNNALISTKEKCPSIELQSCRQKENPPQRISSFVPLKPSLLCRLQAAAASRQRSAEQTANGRRGEAEAPPAGRPPRAPQGRGGALRPRAASARLHFCGGDGGVAVPPRRLHRREGLLRRRALLRPAPHRSPLPGRPPPLPRPRKPPPPSPLLETLALN
jgi:hypothetical protein